MKPGSLSQKEFEALTLMKNLKIIGSSQLKVLNDHIEIKNDIKRRLSLHRLYKIRVKAIGR